MVKATRWLIAGAILLLGSKAWSDPPAPDKRPQAANLPTGNWKIRFANGVIEKGTVQADGTASVVEPLRSSAGKARMEDGALVIVFDDDRVERWTPVGVQMVVEHWFPGSSYPMGPRVLGIAKRVP